LYTDPSCLFFRDISYSYAVIPYNAMGQAGNQVTTTVVQYSVRNLVATTAPIDSSGFQMFYPFDYAAYSVRYSKLYSSIIDNSGILFYYGFDI